MKKVTKRLLVACVAALAVGACQDSVTIVEPAPPPPPPPPPTTPPVDATVTIQGLRIVATNLPANPTAIAGDINVVLNVEEGDNTVTQIDLIWDGVPIGCETVNTNVVPSGEGLRLSTAGSADVVECFWNTDEAVGACIGEQRPARFDNKTTTLGARITLDDGTTRDAANVQNVTTVNSSFITVVQHDFGDANGQGVIGTNGRPFFGGPSDLDGDGTDDNTVGFAACPTSFRGSMIGSLWLEGFTDDGIAGGSHADLGDGSGVAVEDDTPPFIWIVDPLDNDGLVTFTGDAGNATQDDPEDSDVGHEFFVPTSEAVLTVAGLNVSAEFAEFPPFSGVRAGGVVGFDETIYLDFLAPIVAAGAEIEVGGAAVAGGEYFSTGAFGLAGVTDDGVGFTFGMGAGSTIAVGDCDVADNIDDIFDPMDPFVPVDADHADLNGIDDLEEDDPSAGDDGGNAALPPGADDGLVDCYVAEVTNLQDDLGNVTDLEDVGDAINTGDPVTFFGVDRTAADLTNIEPDAAVTVLNPDADANRGINEMTGAADACADAGDCALSFDGADPDLASDEPGSTLDETGCLAGGPCTEIEVDVDDGPTGAPATLPVDNVASNSTDKDGAGDDDFIVDIGFGIALPPDGAYVLDLTAPDFAIPTNDALHTWTFILDDTAPVIGALNPAPVGSAGTDASAIVMSIGETINDANIIDEATLSVFVVGSDATGTGFTGAETCSVPGLAGLYLLDDGAANEIDMNDVDLENGTNAIDFSGANAIAFNIPDPFGAATPTTTVRYCFVLVAEDEAVLADGTDQGNASRLVTQVDVTWNANP